MLCFRERKLLYTFSCRLQACLSHSSVALSRNGHCFHIKRQKVSNFGIRSHSETQTAEKGLEWDLSLHQARLWALLPGAACTAVSAAPPRGFQCAHTSLHPQWYHPAAVSCAFSSVDSVLGVAPAAERCHAVRTVCTCVVRSRPPGGLLLPFVCGRGEPSVHWQLPGLVMCLEMLPECTVTIF